MYHIKEVDGTDPEIDYVLQDIHKETFGFIGIMRTDYGHWWLAYDDDEPIAFAGLVKSTIGPDTGYLKRVGVLPPYRGAGLQRRFIRVREQRARREGWTTIVTDTTDNLPSANSLIRAGYKLFQPTTPWAFSSSLYWRKQLYIKPRR